MALLLLTFCMQHFNLPTRSSDHVWMDWSRCSYTTVFSQKRPNWLIYCKARGWERVHRCVTISFLAHTWNVLDPLTILCYFDSCHWKENKTAAVISVRRELSSFLLNNGRVLADLLQPPVPASLIFRRSLPLLLPTSCGQIQLPALFPFQSLRTASFYSGRNAERERAKWFVTAGGMFAPC